MIVYLMMFPSAWALPSTCSVGNATSDVVAAVARGEEAFGAMSSADLEKAANDATSLIGCLDEQLTKADVASYFRLRGYLAFVQRDKAAALTWFDAAKALIPSYVLPASLVSENHPLRGLYDSAEGGDPPLGAAPLSAPTAGFVTVSGARTEVAPVGRPWVLQQLDANGRVVQTALVMAGEPMPELVVVGGGTPDPEPATTKVPRTSDDAAVALLVRVGPAVQRASAEGALLGEIGPAATVRIGGPVHLDAGATLGVTVRAVDGQRGVQPVLRLGARAELGSGGTRGYVGLAGLGALGRSGFAPGAGALGGVRASLGESALFELDVLAGWTGNSGGGARSGGLWSMVSAGLGVKL
jgi:hypothetical protein